MASPPDGPRGWRAALEPHPSVPEARWPRTRAALALMLALIGMSVLDLAAGAFGAYGPAAAGHSDLAVQAGLLSVLVASYLFARAGRVVAGVVLALLAIELAILHFRIDAHEADAGGAAVTSYFLAVPVLVAGLLLPVRPALAVAAVTLAVALGVEAWLGGTFAIEQEAGLTLMLVAVAALSVAASALATREATLLQERTDLLREVTENVPEVLFVVAADGSRVHYTSPAYESVLGRTVAQSMADPLDWVKAVHPEDLPRVQAARAAGSPEPLEFRAMHPDGAVKHVRTRIFPVRTAHGRVERLVGIVEDVSATKAAEAAVREAQEQRVRLLQQLAHDLASPLTPVKLQLRILRDRVGPAEAPRLDVVQRNMDHLQRLVGDMRDVVRLESTGLRLERADVDLAELAKQAVETLRPTAAERAVELVADVPAPARLPADAGRVTQAYYNLLGNALKFTPAGGKVTIAVVRRAGEVEASVHDTGMGMRPDQLERLFQPFTQVHDPATLARPEDKGTGLGLYITKGIVEAHGGTMAVASGGPGRGTTFTMRFPLAAQAA